MFAVVLGTRPEIIKLAGIIRLLKPSVIHTGQHYDQGMSGDFLDEFGIEVHTYLGIGGQTRAQQIGLAIAALDLSGMEAVIVQGDTNSALAGALAANAQEVPLVHVEAGLRSYDRRMPEEHNRVLIDHLSDLLCAPTETSRANLLREGIDDERIRVTGNTIVEAVLELMPTDRAPILDKYGVKPGEYVLATFHRPENVDDPERFRTILAQLASLELPVLLPLHPRASYQGNGVIPPLGYREFLALSAESAFLVSDSGGIQEEASVYGRPVIVVRNSTERPEVLGTFAVLVQPEDIASTAANILRPRQPQDQSLWKMSRTVPSSRVVVPHLQISTSVDNAEVDNSSPHSPHITDTSSAASDIFSSISAPNTPSPYHQPDTNRQITTEIRKLIQTRAR